MATNRKFYNIIIIALISILSAAVSLFGYATSASADTASPVALAPIAAASDTVYHCFDRPTGIYADGVGIMVTGKNGAEFVSGESEITSRKAFSSDKAVRHLEHGDHSEYIIALDDGTITVYCGEYVTAFDAVGIVDFTVYDDILYAVTENTIITAPLGTNGITADTMSSTQFVSAMHADIHAHGIAVLNGNIYVAIDSVFGNKHDICTVSNDGALDPALLQSDKVLAMSAGGNDTLYVLTRDSVTEYAANGGGLVKKHAANGAGFTAICAYGGNVYALDTLNALYKLSGDLASSTALFASGSDIRGFFDLPSGLAVKSSVLRVADTLNNRIAIYGDSLTYAEREFINPVSVACDSAGTVYIAYEYNKIGIFEAGLLDAETERTVSDPRLGAIKQITISADKTLYILSNTGLWALEHDGDTPVTVSQSQYKSITLGVGRDTLYALGQTAVYMFDGSSAAPLEYCAAATNAVSLAVDLDGAAYMLCPDGIARYHQNSTTVYPFTVNGEAYSLGGNSGQILFCTVRNSFVSMGDVLIADTLKHRVFKTDGTALGVKLIDENYQAPDLAGSNTPEYYGDGLIRTALRDAEVYALPMESEPIYTINRGRNVIVPQYSLEDAQEYSFVLIDDTENGTLVQGYVFKDALSAPLPYSAPPAPVGKIFNTATPVYKFPSRNAKPLKDYSAVAADATFAMLDFVESYRDDYGNLWYRLSLENGTEGYVLGVNISTSNFEPIFIHPAYNAEIVSFKNSTYAVGYLYEDGKYTQIAELPTGTQVEVVGAFDSSSQYTEVKFLDAERGTLTCFVETVYIDYNGVNIVLLVAIVVIIITVILASIIVARVMYTKRKQLMDDTDTD